MERIKDLEEIKKVFDSFNVPIIIGWGLLLGMYRDGKPIEHDDDIDIAVIKPIDLRTRKDIGWMLHDLGFKNQEITFNVFGRMELMADIGYNGDHETGIIVCIRDFKFTIFFFKEVSCETHGQEYVCVPKVGALRLFSTPKKFFEKLDTIKISGKKYLTPYPIEDFLAHSYIDWKDRNGRDHAPTFFDAHPLEKERLEKLYANRN